MINFIFQCLNKPEYEVPAYAKKAPLYLLSLDGQLLAKHDAPDTGWTCESLINTNQKAEPAWNFCGVDAYLGELWVGSSEALKN
ncbi:MULTISPECIES: hypothetical protein [Gammaproteobacteria]|uniref:hypothetical protein n=1 Tax=Gammaproteobacteria TaxID=1236 RepID=UPI0009AE7112|nr:MULTISPECIES: hypothetical protein [Gammaproteobacteria]MCG3741167.1 hypothetical protein [Vibrio cincinnatiensis]